MDKTFVYSLLSFLKKLLILFTAIFKLTRQTTIQRHVKICTLFKYDIPIILILTKGIVKFKEIRVLKLKHSVCYYISIL